MTHYRHLLLLLALSAFLARHAHAQADQPATMPLKERLRAQTALNQMLTKYQETASLEETQQKTFKSLFTKNAIVFDELYPDVINDGRGTDRYTDSLAPKTLSDYIDDVNTKYKPGSLTVNLRRVNFYFGDIYNKNPKKREVKMLFERQSSATLANDLGSLEMPLCTLLMRIVFEDTFSRARIAGIELVSASPLKRNIPDKYKFCPGDDDCDGKPDGSLAIGRGRDECDIVYGQGPDGCPLNRVVLAAGGHIGVFYATPNLSNPSANPGAGYGSESRISLSPKAKASYAVSAGIELEALFGKYQNMSIAAGISIYRTLTPFKVGIGSGNTEFGAADRSSQTYNQIVNAEDIDEEARLTLVQVPVLFKYGNASYRRLGFYAYAGPVFNVSSQVAFKATGSTFNEATYNLSGDNQGDPNYTYQPGGNEDDESAWLIIRRKVPESNTAYWTLKKNAGFNVGAQELKKADEQAGRGFSVGALVRAGVRYRLSRQGTLMLGLSCMSASLGSASQGYQLGYQGAYSSAVATAETVRALNLGVHAGYSYKFKYLIK